jgi:hypothetical protein
MRSPTAILVPARQLRYRLVETHSGEVEPGGDTMPLQLIVIALDIYDANPEVVGFRHITASHLVA